MSRICNTSLIPRLSSSACPRRRGVHAGKAYVAACYTPRMRPDDLAALRERLGLSQQELAARLGVHRVTVARWETGAQPIPVLAILALRALEAGLTGDVTPRVRTRRRG